VPSHLLKVSRLDNKLKRHLFRPKQLLAFKKIEGKLDYHRFGLLCCDLDGKIKKNKYEQYEIRT